MAPKGGIRQRLGGDAVGASEELAGDAAGSSDVPRGGVRSRLDRKRGRDEEESSAHLPMVVSMKKDWGKGKVTSAQVQENVWGAVAQGARGMDKLAAAGGSGKNPQNMQRALISAFGMPMGAPRFTWIEIPTKAGRVAHPFLLPHLWFSALYHHRPELWKRSVEGDAGAAKAFWQSMSDTAIVREHPGLPPCDWERCIPIGFHGDASAFSHQDSLYAFIWNSLIGVGSTTAKRFLFTVVKKSQSDPDTMQAIFKVFAWSMNVLLTGLTPDTDWLMRPLSGGGSYLAGRWKGALVQVRGDWQFYCEVFGFPQWNGAKRMCWMCKASSTIRHLRWTACGADAGWRATRQTHESYVAELRAAGRRLPVMLGEIVGLRLEGIMIDVLHVVDQGVASRIIANMYWELVTKKTWGGSTQDENVARLMESMQTWYKKNKTTSRVQGNLSVERIRTSGNWPKLKAKAAATRHLAKFAHELAATHDDGTPHDRRRLAAMQCLVRFYEILASEGQFMTAAAKTELPALGTNLCVVYSQLAAEAAAKRQKFWDMTPKVHIFQHLCEWQAPEVGNPRFYWVYADEDLVGHMIEVAESSHARTMASTAMFKWLTFAFDA